MPTIYIYEDTNGNVQADLSQPAKSRLLRNITVPNKLVAKKVIKRPGAYIPDRVKALAERVYKELPERDSFTDRVKRAWKELRS